MSDDSVTESPSHEEQVAYLAQWAVRFRAQLELEGECGFGRECVGMLRDGKYLDYSHLWDEYGPDHEFWTPEDAYHKHECMAVLGRGPEAVRQLYEWAKWLDEHGWGTDDVPYKPYYPGDIFELALHGVSTPRLVRLPAADEAVAS
jgi:hypothetical protein